MRKLMIVAAIVCAAAMSQAALVKWGTSNAVSFDGTKLGSKSVQLYMVGVNGADDVLIDTRSTTQNPVGARGNLSAGTGSQSYGYTDTVAGGAVWDSEAGDLGREYYIVIQHTADGKDYTYTSSAVASSGLSATQLGSLSFTINDRIIESGTDGWVAVPEPTSGLLLLLGGAGLALKRRRA